MDMGVAVATLAVIERRVAMKMLRCIEQVDLASVFGLLKKCRAISLLPVGKLNNFALEQRFRNARCKIRAIRRAAIRR